MKRFHVGLLERRSLRGKSLATTRTSETAPRQHARRARRHRASVGRARAGVSGRRGRAIRHRPPRGPRVARLGKYSNSSTLICTCPINRAALDSPRPAGHPAALNLSGIEAASLVKFAYFTDTAPVPGTLLSPRSAEHAARSHGVHRPEPGDVLHGIQQTGGLLNIQVRWINLTAW
jgi:hypothetical protein